jgi:hypothetical protein
MRRSSAVRRPTPCHFSSLSSLLVHSSLFFRPTHGQVCRAFAKHNNQNSRFCSRVSLRQSAFLLESRWIPRQGGGLVVKYEVPLNVGVLALLVSFLLPSPASRTEADWSTSSRSNDSELKVIMFQEAAVEGRWMRPPRGPAGAVRRGTRGHGSLSEVRPPPRCSDSEESSRETGIVTEMMRPVGIAPAQVRAEELQARKDEPLKQAARVEGAAAWTHLFSSFWGYGRDVASPRCAHFANGQFPVGICAQAKSGMNRRSPTAREARCAVK